MACLELSCVGKAFGAIRCADNLSLAVEPGEIVAVFGPSGSGKTVLLRMIAGMFEPDEGDILVGGQSIVGAPPERRGIGMALQNFALFSCFVKGEAAVAIVAVNEAGGEYAMTPLFVSVTDQMVLTDHDGIAAGDLGQLDHFDRTRPVGQAADEAALFQRGDEAVNAGLRAQVERVLHLVEGGRHAGLFQPLIDETQKFVLFAREHLEQSPG